MCSSSFVTVCKNVTTHRASDASDPFDWVDMLFFVTVCKNVTKTEQAMHIFIFGCDPLQKCKLVCAPNEDFGRMNKRLVVSFRGTLQRFVAQIKYSHIVDRAGRGSADRATPTFYVARCAGIAAALGLVPALTLPSQIAKACARLGSKQPSSPTDDSTDPLPISTALPRLSTRHFGLRRPAQVWTDAAPLPLFGPLAREGDGTGQ